MDLSIIIPCHNLEKWIDPLISSLLIQKFEYDVELIFILDNCTDRTNQKILAPEYSQYDSVKIVEVQAGACGLARNYGIDRASGEYIWFIDGDDWLIGPAAINTVLSTIKSENAQIIKFDYEAPKFDFYGYPSMVWQYCMRRDLIGDLRFLPIQPHEDVKFMGSILCDLPDKPFFLNEKIYHYNYMREGSNMQQFRTKGSIDL